VPQQPHLFYGTIADNIRLAKPAATLDEVIAAATTAHAHEFIAKLPQSYATPIGEQGARLSGGQQQRLAIARAFLKDAPVLILDEVTSHLDAESEALIQDALDRLLRDRTVLIIAHRLKLIYTADQVVVMQQGRAIETGTHAVGTTCPLLIMSAMVLARSSFAVFPSWIRSLHHVMACDTVAPFGLMTWVCAM